ncbi:MAG: hypothetical protein R3Y53_11255 [Bacillota bacterium]
MKGGKFVVIKLKELIKTVVFAILGVVIIIGLIYFFLGLGKGDEQSMKYVDGTYYANVVMGQEKAEICVDVSDGKIADVTIASRSESVAVFYPLLDPAMEEVAREVVKNQSLSVQVSEQNTYSAQALLKGVATALEKAVVE